MEQQFTEEQQKIVDAIKQNNDGIKILQDLNTDLAKRMVELCPFKVGDKVLVKQHHVDNGTKCYITELHFEDEDLSYYYSFVRSKNDGTASKQSEGIWNQWIISIVKI